MPTPRIFDGKLILAPGGIGGTDPCCCGAPADPCASVTCTSPVAPSIILTVSGTTGTINWCNETWVLPGDSGLEKCVCPTAYQLLTHPTPTNTTTYTFTRRERWTYNVVAPSLRLQRSFFKNFVTSPGYYYLYKDVTARIKTNGAAVYRDDRHRTIQYSAYAPIFTGDITVATLGVFNPSNNAYLPTKNNYRILDIQFGSATKNAIVYGYAKGDGW